MSEQRRTQSSHETESIPAANSWEEVKIQRDMAAARAEVNDNVWEQHGGASIDKLLATMEDPEEAEKSTNIELLEESRWAFYHSYIGSKADRPTLAASLPIRDSMIDMLAVRRAELRAEADKAETAWEELGGAKLDKAEAVQAEIRAKGVSAADDTEYQKAIRDVGEAKKQVAANWQEQHGASEPEAESSPKRTRTTSKLGARATSMFGGKKRKVRTETPRNNTSSETKTDARAEEKTSTSAPDESLAMPTEAEAKKAMEAQIKAYEEQGHTDASWNMLQQSILRYELIQNDRHKRDINAMIDAAYNAADTAQNASPSVSEDLVASKPAETEPTTKLINNTDDKSTETSKRKNSRTRKIFTRATRATKRARSRFGKKKTAQPEQHASPASTTLFSSSERADVENQPSLGDLVQTDRSGSDRNNSEGRSDADKGDSTLADAA